MEVKRQIDVLDRRLADNQFVAGNDYTIADMAIWPWYGGLVKGWLYDAAEFLSVQDHKNVARWADQLFARPAVARGRKVNRTSGAPSSQLRERHDARERSEENKSELQAQIRYRYAGYCLKKN